MRCQRRRPGSPRGARRQRVHGADRLQVAGDREDAVVLDRDALHLHHRIGESRVHQRVAEVVHVDEALHVRRAVGSANAARSSLSVSGPNVEKRKRPSAVSTRAASAKTRAGLAPLQREVGEDELAPRRPRAAGAPRRRTPAPARRAPSMRCHQASGRARARASPARGRCPTTAARGKALRQRVEGVPVPQPRSTARAGVEADRVEVLEQARAHLALQDGRLVVGPRGALEGAAHVALHRQQRSSMQSALEGARRNSAGGSRRAGARRRRSRRSARRQRARRASGPPPTGASASRAPWITTAGAVDRRDFVAQVRVAQQGEPGGERFGRGRPALDQQRGELAHPARGPAAPPSAFRSTKARIVFAGSSRRPCAKSSSVAARHRVRPAVARDEAGRGAHEGERRRRAQGGAWRGAARPARPATSRRRSRLRARSRPRASTTASSVAEGDAARVPVAGKVDEVEAEASRRAVARARATRRRAGPSRAAARGPGRSRASRRAASSRRTSAERRGQRQHLLRGNAPRRATRAAARCRRAPSAGGSRARGGRARAGARKAPRRARHRRRSPAGSRWRRRSRRPRARRRGGTRRCARAASPRSPGARRSGRRASVATAAAAGGSAVEKT